MNTISDNQQAAGLARRLAAILYDSLLVAGLLVLASALVTLPIGLLLGPERSGELGESYLFAVWLCLIPYLFFVGFWIRGGQTLGMRVWRLRLVSDRSGPVTLTQASIRFAAAILSWAPLGLGFLWSLFDREGLSWHDRLSASRLVQLQKS